MYRVLVEIPEGMRPLGKPRNRWEVNIGVDFKQRLGGCGLDSAG